MLNSEKRISFLSAANVPWSGTQHNSLFVQVHNKRRYEYAICVHCMYTWIVACNTRGEHYRTLVSHLLHSHANTNWNVYPALNCPRFTLQVHTRRWCLAQNPQPPTDPLLGATSKVSPVVARALDFSFSRLDGVLTVCQHGHGSTEHLSLPVLTFKRSSACFVVSPPFCTKVQNTVLYKLLTWPVGGGNRTINCCLMVQWFNAGSAVVLTVGLSPA